MIEYGILGMLYDCCLTGYDLKQAIENGVGVFYRVSYGSIYPALKKLAGLGCVTMTEVEGSGRGKKEYRITQLGRERFLGWLREPVHFEESTKNQLLKIYFYDKLPEETREEYLAEYEQSCRKYLRSLQGIREKLDSRENRENHYFKLSTLYYGICVTRTSLEWCRMLRARQPLAEGEEAPC